MPEPTSTTSAEPIDPLPVLFELYLTSPDHVGPELGSRREGALRAAFECLDSWGMIGE